MTDFRYLEWDTDFFGFSVAEITDPSVPVADLNETLRRLKDRGVRLVYWPASSQLTPSECSALEAVQSIRVNKRILFSIDLIGYDHSNTISNVVIKPYDSLSLCPALVRLAIQSGEYSRFALDPNIPKGKFTDLYTLWIEKSVKKEMADKVFVLNVDQEIAGMISVQKKNETGVIGLLAVDEKFSDKKYGRLLVDHAIAWFLKEGCQRLRLITQKENAAAYNFYSKRGFDVEKRHFFTHFWL